jgi:hypothetical protein
MTCHPEKDERISVPLIRPFYCFLTRETKGVSPVLSHVRHYIIFRRPAFDLLLFNPTPSYIGTVFRFNNHLHLEKSGFFKKIDVLSDI